MRTTITLDDELLATAHEMTGVTERSTLIHNGLRLLIQREAARRLALLGGSDPTATAAPRRRSAPVAVPGRKPSAAKPARRRARGREEGVILVDSSIWIDHLRRADAELVRLLAGDEVLCHPFVIGELACGHLRQRAAFLAQLRALPLAAATTPDEAIAFVERHALAGCGIGWANMHLLSATLLAQPAALWTRDKRLAAAAAELGCLHEPRLH